MDAFEGIVAEVLRWDGYWVHNSYKVELPPQDKRDIGKPTMPRLELDVVAYKGGSNEVFVVECKSYLDSPGVRYSGFDGSGHRAEKRYKLFNDETLRRIVLNRLVVQMTEAGLVAENPRVMLALAAGKFVSDRDRMLLQAHFDDRGWILWDNTWLRDKLQEMSTGGYENSTLAVATKLLLR